ncbi:MAG: hypothetical protein V2B19_08255 [Pseudomonadota bacterium]
MTFLNTDRITGEAAHEQVGIARPRYDSTCFKKNNKKDSDIPSDIPSDNFRSVFSSLQLYCPEIRTINFTGRIGLDHRFGWKKYPGAADTMIKAEEYNTENILIGEGIDIERSGFSKIVRNHGKARRHIPGH